MPASTSPAIDKLIAQGLFQRLPVTFSTAFFDKVKDWPRLFPAERNYFERLAALLDRSGPQAVEELFAGLRSIEEQMGVRRIKWNTGRFTLEQTDFLQRSPYYPRWRRAVEGIFARIDPLLEQEVARSGRPRLVLVISPAELPASPDRMWLEIRKHGRLVDLDLDEEADPAGFLPRLLTGAPAEAHRPPLPVLQSAHSTSRYEAWQIEAGSRLHHLTPNPGAGVRLSYDLLETYRHRLMDEVQRLLERKNIPGPQQLGEELAKLRALPTESEFGADPVMAEFLRSVLLAGNGTLLLNNTFVEWTTVQAVRRARPALTVVSFGVRNKVKPFSSLLIYTDQSASSPIPDQMDTLGTYVDLEKFYLYIWQEFEKYAEYRLNTAYLFLGEGMDQMLLIAPPDFPLDTAKPHTLEAIHRAARDWLRIRAPEEGGVSGLR